MKTILSTLSAALMLTAGAVQAEFYINDFDAMLTGTADSDNSAELRDYQPRQSLPADFVPHIVLLDAYGPDSDNTLESRDWTRKRSLPLAFVPSVDLWEIGSADHDGTVEIRPDGKPCPLGAAKQGIC